MSRAQQTEDCAARWLLAQEDSSWSDADQAAFDAWLSESDGNRVAYLRLRQGWREVDRIGGLPNIRAGSSKHQDWFGRRHWSNWNMPLAAAASAALLLWGTYAITRPSTDSSPPRIEGHTYSTPIGGRRTITFADGSAMELNTSSDATAMVTRQQREVWLQNGEAFFQVTHKKGVPFIVHAGNRQITVLGTKFSVRRAGEKVTVSVLEGRVRVDEMRADRPVRSSVIAAGDIAVAKEETTLVTAQLQSKVEDALAWRRGMLRFERSTLAEVAGEFNRYNDRKMIVSPDAASVVIGGSFPAGSPQGFANLLHDAYGLKVEKTSREIRISN